MERARESRGEYNVRSNAWRGARRIAAILRVCAVVARTFRPTMQCQVGWYFLSNSCRQGAGTDREGGKSDKSEQNRETKHTAHTIMPRWGFSVGVVCSTDLLNVRSDVLLDSVLGQSGGGHVHSFLLHLLAHISILHDGTTHLTHLRLELAAVGRETEKGAERGEKKNRAAEYRGDEVGTEVV